MSEISSEIGDFEIGALLAYQGKEGCTDSRCTRMDGRCHGYHCPVCHEPCSMMGHKKCQEEAAKI